MAQQQDLTFFGMNNKSIEDIVREVLDMYVGTQLNIDSEVARGILASHIAADIEDSQQDSADYVDDDLSV